MRRILTCYSEVPLPDLASRMFLPQGYETTSAEIGQLLEVGEIEAKS